MNDSNSALPSSQPTPRLTPRIEQAGPLMIAGLRIPLAAQAATQIPQLWQELAQHQAHIPQRVGETAYGLCIRMPGGAMQYLAGVAVWDFDGLADPVQGFVVPAQDYAVFNHQAPVSSIRQTIDAMFDQWLPDSGYQLPGQQPLHFFERYGPGFNASTGTGPISLWLPITPITPVTPITKGR